MKLDSQALTALLGDLTAKGYTGNAAELGAAIRGYAVQSQLRRMHTQLQEFYGAAFIGAQPLFNTCLAFVGTRFTSVHGEGPASCEPYITVSRVLSGRQAADASTRVVWMDLRLSESSESLVVDITFYGKGDYALRERRYVFGKLPRAAALA